MNLEIETIKYDTNMNTDNYTKQSPINEEGRVSNVSAHHLLTADEFIAQMEPRIRSLFRWNSFE